MKKIVTFGEIMLRLSPPNQQRFGQARTFDASYGGGESNVAVSLSNYGMETEFVTRLPKNDLGEAALSGQKLNASAASPPPKRLTFSFTIGLKQ